MPEIRQNQIWRVTTNNFSGNTEEVIKCEHCGHSKRETKLLPIGKGTYIEIRYATEWNFRTDYGKYYHATPADIYANAVYFRTVTDIVCWGNKHSLREILDKKLYNI